MSLIIKSISLLYKGLIRPVIFGLISATLLNRILIIGKVFFFYKDNPCSNNEKPKITTSLQKYIYDFLIINVFWFSLIVSNTLCRIENFVLNPEWSNKFFKYSGYHFYTAKFIKNNVWYDKFKFAEQIMYNDKNQFTFAALVISNIMLALGINFYKNYSNIDDALKTLDINFSRPKFVGNNIQTNSNFSEKLLSENSYSPIENLTLKN